MPTIADDDPACRIFLSYHKRNQAIAKSVAEAIRADIAANFPPPDHPPVALWWDESLEAGDVWDPRIQTEIERADIILFLIAPACMDATYMWNDEFAVALERFRSGEGRVRLVPLVYSDAPAPIRTNRFTRRLNHVLEKPADQLGEAEWLRVVAEGVRPGIAGVIRQVEPPQRRLGPALGGAVAALEAARSRFDAAPGNGFFGPVPAFDLQNALGAVEAALGLPGRERMRSLSVWTPKLRDAYFRMRAALPDHARTLGELRDALDETATFAAEEDAAPPAVHAPALLADSAEAREDLEGVRAGLGEARVSLEALAEAPPAPTATEQDARDYAVETGARHAALAEAILDEQRPDIAAMPAAGRRGRALAAPARPRLRDRRRCDERRLPKKRRRR